MRISIAIATIAIGTFAAPVSKNHQESQNLVETTWPENAQGSINSPTFPSDEKSRSIDSVTIARNADIQSINSGTNSRREPVPYTRNGQRSARKRAPDAARGSEGTRKAHGYVRPPQKRTAAPEPTPQKPGLTAEVEDDSEDNDFTVFQMSARSTASRILTTREAEPVNRINGREPEPVNRINGREAEPVNRINGREPEPVNRINGREAEPINRATTSRREAEPKDRINSREAEPVNRGTNSRREAEPMDDSRRRSNDEDIPFQQEVKIRGTYKRIAAAEPVFRANGR